MEEIMSDLTEKIYRSAIFNNTPADEVRAMLQVAAGGSMFNGLP